MKANYIINEELNGIEVIFTEKPEAETLEALKGAGFRWHKIKKLWYAKNTPERLQLAESIASGCTPEATKKTKINLEGIESKPCLYGAELTKAIREELKKRGVHGVSVRKSQSSVYVTVKATENDLSSLEEMKERYPFYRFSADVERRYGLYIDGSWVYTLDGMTEEEQQSLYIKHLKHEAGRSEEISRLPEKRDLYFEYTAEFYNKLCAVWIISDQWNYNNSDSMTDYFDYGYFLQIEVKKPESVEVREAMTEEEKAAYKAEKEAEEAEEERQLAEYLKAEEERKAAYKKYEEEHQARLEIIENGSTMQELATPIYFNNLAGGIGKEATAKELRETIEENPHFSDCVVNYVLTLTPDALEAFEKEFLTDFDFLAGKGGTNTSDIRVTDENFNKLNSDQLASVKFYNVNCVAVLSGGAVKYVIDPQGYSYSRYVFIPTENTKQRPFSQVDKEQEAESREKKAFYIPEALEKQIANIKIGDPVTIYKCDGWILTNIEAGAGIVESVESGSYAQYKGYYVTLSAGKKKHSVFLRDNNDTLIYAGFLPRLPEEVTKRRISENMTEILTYNTLFANTLAYYEAQGKRPILDTIQR